jgi:hypothetical protein
MLSSPTIAASLIKFHQQQAEEIEAFWVECRGSRQKLQSELEVLFEGLPILVAIVAGGRFFDPDGIVDDLSLTITENIDWFTQPRRESIIRDQKFSIVLVSKTQLGVPQLSSPVSLPDWFPLWPSKLLTANIKSANPVITLSLASADIPEVEINNALFMLEEALTRRLTIVLHSAAAATNALQTAIAASTQAPATVAGLVASSKAAIQSRTSGEFRPGGAANSEFVVSQLARLWRDCAPRDRYMLASHTADALGLNAVSIVDVQFSLTSLLTRGKEKLSTTPAQITFCRNLLSTVSDIVQFINGRHHADEFPEFPAEFTIAFATELANSCRKAAQALNEQT